MNKIRVLLNAVKGSNIKVNITMNNGITYNCYEEIALSNDVIRFVDDDNNRIVLEYEDITGIKVAEV